MKVVIFDDENIQSRKQRKSLIVIMNQRCIPFTFLTIVFYWRIILLVHRMLIRLVDLSCVLQYWNSMSSYFFFLSLQSILWWLSIHIYSKNSNNKRIVFKKLKHRKIHSCFLSYNYLCFSSCLKSFHVYKFYLIFIIYHPIWLCLFNQLWVLLESINVYHEFFVIFVN